MQLFEGVEKQWEVAAGTISCLREACAKESTAADGLDVPDLSIEAAVVGKEGEFRASKIGLDPVQSKIDAINSSCNT